MSSALTDCRTPDPTDAKADGQFQQVANRRAGYGEIVFDGQAYTKLEWILRYARKGANLAANEGQFLLEHFEEQLAAKDAELARLRADLTVSHTWSDGTRAIRYRATCLADAVHELLIELRSGGAAAHLPAVRAALADLEFAVARGMEAYL